MSGFLNRWLGRSPEPYREPVRVEARMSAAEPTAPVASSAPEASRTAPMETAQAPRTMLPSPFGQFGENGEKVGEHISYFLARLDDVYSLRQEFAAVAEPMQQFVRSHDEAQTRLAETAALLSRERDEGQLSRSDNLVPSCGRCRSPTTMRAPGWIGRHGSSQRKPRHPAKRPMPIAFWPKNWPSSNRSWRTNARAITS